MTDCFGYGGPGKPTRTHDETTTKTETVNNDNNGNSLAAAILQVRQSDDDIQIWFVLESIIV